MDKCDVASDKRFTEAIRIRKRFNILFDPSGVHALPLGGRQNVGGHYLFAHSPRKGCPRVVKFGMGS